MKKNKNMDTKKSMDLFGQSLYDYFRGGRNTPMYFIYQGERKERSVSYFRSPSRCLTIEKHLFELSYGNILDIGCATGNYLPNLIKRRAVDAIDISEYAIKVAKGKGLKCCEVADIFNLKTSKKYDTITLLENNLGMGGSLEKVAELLKILKTLLKESGQTLIIQENQNLVNMSFETIELPEYADVTENNGDFEHWFVEWSGMADLPVRRSPSV